MTSSGTILTRTRLRRSTSNCKGCSESWSPHDPCLNATLTKIEQANAANSLSDTSRQAEFQVLDAPPSDQTGSYADAPVGIPRAWTGGQLRVPPLRCRLRYLARYDRFVTETIWNE